MTMSSFAKFYQRIWRNLFFMHASNQVSVEKQLRKEMITMKKNTMKKMMAGVLTVATLTIATGSALAASPLTFQGKYEIAKVSQIKTAQYESFTGIVKEIRQHATDASIRYILLENEEGMTANIVTDADTYYIKGVKIALGDTITGYYRGGMPMIMIYPPQYNVDVVAGVLTDEHLKVDRFDENLLSADGSLKLNVDEKTPIIGTDGKAYTGQITNKRLAVVYGITLRSYPAQTSPHQIIVLGEQGESLPGIESMPLVVENKRVKAPAAYQDENGVVMVPLREIVRALGKNYYWNGSLQMATINQTIYLWPGHDVYVDLSGENGSSALGTAPAMVNGRLYVPLRFFKDVVGVNNAYVFEGQIVIDNGEIMH